MRTITSASAAGALTSFCLGLICLTSAGCSEPMPTFSPQNRAAVLSALKIAGLPTPQQLDLNKQGYLAAIFEVELTDVGGSPRSFGEKALVTIREALPPDTKITSYRVTVNGPSPGRGMIRRYGSARFHEGSSIDWEEGIRR
jgi:hypothetical protein